MIRILIAALLTAFLTVPAQAGTWKSIATWDIEYAENGCFTIDRYKNGTIFGFGLDSSGAFDLILINEAWNLTKGERLAQVKVDDSTWSKHTATAISPTILKIAIAMEAESFRVLAVGSTLKVRLGAVEFGYKLTGTKLMLPELIKCAVSLKNASFL
jgi:hypothetical protein